MSIVGLFKFGAIAFGAFAAAAAPAMAQEKRPNIVMLMTDDTGWNDFGAYSNGGKALGHPTPNVDRIAEEGATFTNWYGQASCTAGRASFITGRIPIRSALSIVVAPGDPNFLRKETPTIAEFFKKNGYSTYFSGKWHLGDKPESYPIEHGFDEMKNFAAYYAGVYTYDYTNKWFHPWFPSYNPQFAKYYSENVNLAEWEGVAGQPAKNLGTITYDRFATFDEDQAANAVNYIKAHANDDKPFFMDVNYLKMHNPTNAAPDFAGKSHLGDYSDSLMELDADIGKVMDEIRKDAPNTIVIVTADNGAWLDAYPDAGTTPFRGEKGSPFEGGWRVPGIMWWPGHIPARAKYDEMMSHIDAWATLAAMVGLTPPPHEWVGNDGKPIYFDCDRQQRLHPRQGRAFGAQVVDLYRRRDLLGRPGRYRRRSRGALGAISPGSISTPPGTPGWVSKADLGAIGATYNLTMDPYEKYDMTFNGAAPSTVLQASPGKYAGQDNGWVLALIGPVMIEFDKSIMKFPNIQRFVGGASTDLDPESPASGQSGPAVEGADRERIGEPHVEGGGG